MRHSVSIDGNCLLVDGTRVPLLSGEFHYFRHARTWWGQILDAVADGGLNMVCSYVCWDFHELEPGRYDFTGQNDPQRDLDGFLKLCEQKGIYVLLRPGPYIGGEWKNWGVPDHAAAYHRLDPRFLAKARHYLEAVLPIVREHQVTEGGCVLMVQVDNEIDMNQAIYTPTVGHPSFSPLFWKQIVTGGTADEPGTFRQWFKAKYGSVAELNQAWQTTYGDFAEVEPPVAVPTTPGDRRRLLDAQEFWEGYSLGYLNEMLAMYRAAGLSVPFFANTYSSPLPMNQARFQELVDLVGPDFYCSTPVRPEELLGMSLGVKLRRTATRIPWSPELQAGTVSSWVAWRGPVTPEHHRYMGLLGMLFGLKGWNWYMLVNRDEWYFAPINEKGEVREHYYRHFRDLVRAFHEVDWPDAEKCCQTALLWYRPHFWFSQHPATALTHGISGEVSRASLTRRTQWTQAFNSLHAGGVDFDLYDPCGKPLRSADTPLLIYAGFDFVEDSVAQTLLHYAGAGGSVVIFGAPPRKSLDGAGLSLLGELLPPVDSIIRWGGELRFTLDGRDYQATSEVVCSYDIGDRPELRPIRGLGSSVGYVLPYGSGRFYVLGLDANADTLRFAYEAVGAAIPAQAAAPGVLTSAWRGRKGVHLVVVNTTPDAVNTTLQLDLKALGLRTEPEYRVDEVLSGRQQVKRGSELVSLAVSVPGRDGLILSIC